MNRLTEKRDDGSYKLKGMEWDPPLRPRSGKLLMNKIYGVIQRLGAYEDTGLMPDEIGKLNAETQEEAHIKPYENASVSEIIKALKNIRDSAYGYHIGNETMGIPTQSFISLMDEEEEE